MYINKHFKELNIEPISKVDIREKCEFANKAAILLVDTFPEYNLDYLKIVDMLQHTEMYISKIPKNISPVNYSYIDQTMYISEEIDFNIKNEYVLHEVIHRIQEYRNKRNQLFQLGLCNILETRIQGLAINEAAVQYVVAKTLQNQKQIVEVYGMKIPTISKNYYPIITSLIEQLAFVLGDRLLIDSVLNSNEEFKYNAIDSLGEDSFFTIQANFDKILEAKDKILKNQEGQNIIENIKTIKDLYIETQNIILTSYFNHLFKRIETLNELDRYSRKILKYREFIGSDEGQMLYFEFYKLEQEKIKELEKKLKNKSLTVVKENKVLKILRKIRRYFEKIIFQN